MILPCLINPAGHHANPAGKCRWIVERRMFSACWRLKQRWQLPLRCWLRMLQEISATYVHGHGEKRFMGGDVKAVCWRSILQYDKAFLGAGRFFF